MQKAEQMSKEIYISSTPQETRLAIVEKDELTEIYYERENEYTLAGSIYNGKVTRVLPGMQSSFVDIGLERDAFLYITDFMEEQSETADFDSGEARNGRRPGRERGRREEGNGGAPPVEAEAPRSEDERRDQPERHPERNGARTRREGFRGDGRGEASPAFTRAADADSGEDASAPEEESLDPGTLSGAPGADSSRRWRGRRGRRRGRTGAEGNGAPASAPTEEAEREFARPSEEEEGTAEFLDAVAEIPSTPEQRRETGERFGGRDRRRDDRGGRKEGHSRDRNESRGPRHTRRERDQADSPALSPELSPGLSPSSSPSTEPFILPGESLSKYRKGTEASAPGGELAAVTRSAIPTLTAKPSTQVELAGVWDGGPTLPGETLSRHRGGSSAASPAPAAAKVHPEAQAAERREDNGTEFPATGRDRRRERDLRRGRQPDEGARVSEGSPNKASAPEGFSPAEAVQPGIASFHEPEATHLPLNDDGSPRDEDFSHTAAPVEDITVAAFEEIEDEPTTGSQPAADPAAAHGVRSEPAAYEPQTEAAPPSGTMPAAVLEAVEQFHETVAEFEPGEEASASFRVDPAGPSEFRQSAPDADVLVEVRLDDDEPLAPAGPGHEFGGEFTAVQSSGEMISEWPLTPEAGVAAKEFPVETAPIIHEAAVQSVRLEDAEAPAAPSREFDPGDGRLEVELLDEEDGDPLQLQASFSDDEMEEETLEGAADLGSMIREMSIDQITSAGSAEAESGFDLEEDDFEEDDLEDDEPVEGGRAGEPDAEDGEASGREFLTVRGRVAEEQGGSDAVDEFAEFAEFAEEPASLSSAPASGAPARERRDGRRGGRDRGGREYGGRRDRNGTASRPPSHGGGRMTRHQAQTSDLPAISDLLKPGQEVLVQIAKEPIAKKGARITSHIALPGRFLVFMPTVHHVGVSRKIESDAERRRLKEILISERGEASGGFIVRTAASGASEDELRSDLRFLLNLWVDIKQRSDSSKSPALIYHDLNLVERILRDQVTDNFSAIWVDTETEYERVLRFLQRFQPSLIRRVKLYTKDTPLFEQFGISEEINKALRSKVWLKSGGSIVINQTEALVAIDINTGKYVGKTARLEDTIVKTNLDAIPEIVRQIRLRDLGGIIVIDFIDMDERRNRAKVLAVLEEELKKDRAPSKVLQFNDFGLVAITRKRVKQSLERTLSITCNTCAGTGMVKSPVTVCNEIFIEFRKMHRHLDKGDVMLRVNPEVVKQLKAGGGKWLQEMEEVAGKTILVKSDPSLHPEQFDIQ